MYPQRRLRRLAQHVCARVREDPRSLVGGQLGGALPRRRRRGGELDVDGGHGLLAKDHLACGLADGDGGLMTHQAAEKDAAQQPAQHLDGVERARARLAPGSARAAPADQ